ncbi:response regulator [Pseudobacteriovorax antillogorgiicola]|uniref:CheY chemotaxis protein or a CheY-like REC (Receiver) domain n=1 Tax=Pseudobacteriovorax antillogorgiicola TaxID=1513793 RepID=A0A1Y6BB68_9BACT|nr:response regulator [Pseudobacteriovorax antillogorgiicola]TCS57342.1 CheY-like chemotaxis protein [Pseudobacteriovorax antillogorgiicola]SMF02237.1 CheY chemotaxis protein or a CheY-like REC (receiver) domain [Pseudobacteriovorax antillogorgiicola]
MASYKILVAEDCEDVSKMLRRVIEIMGAEEHMTWQFCSNLKDLEELHLSLEPDLILSDISFPDGDSLSLLNRLSQDGKLDGKLLVAYTSYDYRHIPEAKIFDSYISKDTDPLQVINTCMSLVRNL